jgi:hypothetical protein
MPAFADSIVPIGPILGRYLFNPIWHHVCIEFYRLVAIGGSALARAGTIGVTALFRHARFKRVVVQCRVAIKIVPLRADRVTAGVGRIARAKRFGIVAGHVGLRQMVVGI